MGFWDCTWWIFSAIKLNRAEQKLDETLLVFFHLTQFAIEITWLLAVVGAVLPAIMDLRLHMMNIFRNQAQQGWTKAWWNTSGLLSPDAVCHRDYMTACCCRCGVASNHEFQTAHDEYFPQSSSTGLTTAWWNTSGLFSPDAVCHWNFMTACCCRCGVASNHGFLRLHMMNIFRNQAQQGWAKAWWNTSGLLSPDAVCHRDYMTACCCRCGFASNHGFETAHDEYFPQSSSTGLNKSLMKHFWSSFTWRSLP